MEHENQMESKLSPENLAKSRIGAAKMLLKKTTNLNHMLIPLFFFCPCCLNNPHETRKGYLSSGNEPNS